MARAVAQDYLHNFRFEVVITSLNVAFGNDISKNAGGGFSTCGAPMATTESVLYKEGTFIFSRKQPGHTTFNDITLGRGVVVTDSSLWNWSKQVIGESGEYRADLKINHLTRSALPTHQVLTPTTAPSEKLTLPATTYRTYNLYNAYPVTFKPTSDMDGSNSAVSVSELGIAYEFFTMQDTAPA